MQRKKAISAAGPFYLLQADVLEFVRTWKGPGPKLEKENDLSMLVRVAIEPKDLLPSSITKDGVGASAIDPLWLACQLVKAPDFVLAFLPFVRRLWLKNSKRQRLQNFLATHSAHFRKSRGWECAEFFDKELADQFNKESGRLHDEMATQRDVEKAREAIAKRVGSGHKLSRNTNLQKSPKV